MTPYVAFLRGINVGGNAVIRMTDLAKVFTALKFKNVRTFIASGNVLFETEEKDSAALIGKIERHLKIPATPRNWNTVNKIVKL